MGAGGVVEFCVAFDNFLHQIAVEGTTVGAIVRYNQVYGGRPGEGLAGIELSTTTDSQVYGNVISDQTNGIALYLSPVRPLIYDNTIIRTRDAGINIAFDNVSITGVVLRNNIVSTSGTYVVTTGPYAIANFSADFNLWHSDGSSKMHYNGTTTDLVGWRAATSQDANSIDAKPFDMSSATPPWGCSWHSLGATAASWHDTVPSHWWHTARRRASFDAAATDPVQRQQRTSRPDSLKYNNASAPTMCCALARMCS